MGRERFVEAIEKLAKDTAKKILGTSKNYAPRHIAPHIYVKTEHTSKERMSITLGVKRVESFERNSRIPGAASGGGKGTLDAFAQEFGSGEKAEGGGTSYTITPRKRTGKVQRKYTSLYKKNKDDVGLRTGLVYERGWLVIPNQGKIPEGAGKGYRPNMTSDGNFLFVKEVEHKGIHKYEGRGYLRIAVRENMDTMTAEARKSVANAIKATMMESLPRSGKVIISGRKD